MVATLTLLQDVTANAALLTLLDRAALGDRPARPGPARPAGPRAGRQPRPGARALDVRRPSSHAAVAGADPTEIAVARATRWTTRATRDYSPEARRAVRPARRRAAPAARRTSASRCSTWSAGSSTPPASTSSWPRRSAPPRAARRDNLDLFVQGGRGVPGRRRRRSRWPRCWPTSRPRTSTATGLDVATPDRGRLGQAAHRPPGQGPRVGRGVPGRRLTERKFPTNRARSSWTDGARRCCPAALRGDARDLPQLRRPHARRHRRAHRGGQGARGASRSSGSATSPGPAPGTCSSVSA